MVRLAMAVWLLRCLAAFVCVGLDGHEDGQSLRSYMYVLNVLSETNEHDSQETMYIIMVQYYSHSH